MTLAERVLCKLKSATGLILPPNQQSLSTPHLATYGIIDRSLSEETRWRNHPEFSPSPKAQDK